MPAWAVDGMDVLAVEDAAASGGDRRSGPAADRSFLELRTYRFRAHSMYDPERYRAKEEVEAWRERDPIDLAPARGSSETGLLDRRRPSRRSRPTSPPSSTRAVGFAEAGTLEPVEDLTRFVYSEATPMKTDLPGGDARGPSRRASRGTSASSSWARTSAATAAASP